jgi:hypothetical protein
MLLFIMAVVHILTSVLVLLLSSFKLRWGAAAAPGEAAAAC